MKNMARRRGRPSRGEYLLECHKKTLYLLERLEEKGIGKPSSLEREELIQHIMDILEINRSTAYMWSNFIVRLTRGLYK